MVTAGDNTFVTPARLPSCGKQPKSAIPASRRSDDNKRMEPLLYRPELEQAKRLKDQRMDRKRARREQHRRDIGKVDGWIERLREPVAESLASELADVVKNQHPGIPMKWWYKREMTRAERVKFDRLRFDLNQVTQPVSEEVERRWVRYGLDPIDAKSMEAWDRGFLRRAVPDFDQRIADAKAEGVEPGDPYMVWLRRTRREMNRKLKRASRVELLKAKAASA